MTRGVDFGTLSTEAPVWTPVYSSRPSTALSYEGVVSTAGTPVLNLPQMQQQINQLESELATLQRGCWLVFHPDFSDAWVYGSELEALRHAVREHCNCRWVDWGISLRSPFDERFDGPGQ